MNTRRNRRNTDTTSIPRINLDGGQNCFLVGLQGPHGEEALDLLIPGAASLVTINRRTLGYGMRLGDMVRMSCEGFQYITHVDQTSYYPNGQLPFTGRIRSTVSSGYMLVTPDEWILRRFCRNGLLMAHLDFTILHEQIKDYFAHWGEGLLAGATVRFDLTQRDRSGYRFELAIGRMDLVELAPAEEPEHYRW